MASDVKCPVCGSRTRLRVSKKDGSKFHVCINYPRCKGRVAYDEAWGDDWGDEKTVSKATQDRSKAPLKSSKNPSERVRVSREEFVQALLYCLWNETTEEKVRKVADDCDFELADDDSFGYIRLGWLTINIWFLVDACRAAIKDEEKRYDCLDRFLHLVFKQVSGDKMELYNDWFADTSKACRIYNGAMGMKYVETGLLEENSILNVSKVIIESLKPKITYGNPLAMTKYVISALMAYPQMVDKYDIH